MSQPTSSVRTAVRDAVMQTLDRRRRQDGVRVPEYDVRPIWATLEECERFPTYCVLVTDEQAGERSQRDVESLLTVKLVVYAKDEKDPRRVLDAALEDVHEALLSVRNQLIEQAIAWNLAWIETTADEGTSVAHPHAQAMVRWHCQFHRAQIGS